MLKAFLKVFLSTVFIDAPIPPELITDMPWLSHPEIMETGSVSGRRLGLCSTRMTQCDFLASLHFCMLPTLDDDI